MPKPIDQLSEFEQRAIAQEEQDANCIRLILGQLFQSRPSTVAKASNQLMKSPEPDEMADFVLEELDHFLRCEGFAHVEAWSEKLIEKLRKGESA